MSGTPWQKTKVLGKRKYSVSQLLYESQLFSTMILSAEQQRLAFVGQQMLLLDQERQRLADESRQCIAEWAAYEREREMKTRGAHLKRVEEKQGTAKLLKYVVEGDQAKAEALLREKPGLACLKGRVRDLSQREFKEITGFQYAVWALDWHMWKMLLKYLPTHIAALQLAELEEQGTAHGKHFSLVPLIKSLNEYAKNYKRWFKAGAWDKIENHWCRLIGENQLLLPAHVVNEYCHKDRAFNPCPKFKEETLPRNMELNIDERPGYWFTILGGLGKTFGTVRYKWTAAQGICVLGENGVKWISSDIIALQSLWKIRQQQLEDLKDELQYFLGVKKFF